MKDSASKSATSQIRQTLWASLINDTTENDRQENRQRKTLILLKNYFVNWSNKSGDQNPLKKNGADSEKLKE